MTSPQPVEDQYTCRHHEEARSAGASFSRCQKENSRLMHADRAADRAMRQFIRLPPPALVPSTLPIGRSRHGPLRNPSRFSPLPEAGLPGLPGSLHQAPAGASGQRRRLLALALFGDARSPSTITLNVTGDTRHVTVGDISTVYPSCYAVSFQEIPG